jgi:(p)ppGpp synthase/HD superfamily hydrolase
MLLAMARDVRVILIKLADRSTTCARLGDVPREKMGHALRRKPLKFTPPSPTGWV